MQSTTVRLGASALLAAAFLAPSPAPNRVDDTRIIDLTHAFDERTIYWPTAKPFTWEKEAWGRAPGGYWYTAGRYSASEHGGTHLDAPIHFAEGQQAADEVPLSRLLGPAAVIDVSEAAARDRDYRVGPGDLHRWEISYGPIPPNSIVLIRSGWARFWTDRKRYLGSAVPRDTANLHFPGISREAAELLVRRRVDAVGIDTPSLDNGQSRDFMAHRILSAANIPGLENVASLEQLPPAGATVIALPMKIRGGSGGPARIIALLP
ncbi:cyclase family protein [Sphingomonas sp. GCM10030256]|uniref:cyclase family protein n=1 Tax=Sphingomonas sp. GCM10030256 TaxID=3273427 RepID=UPI0036217B8B